MHNPFTGWPITGTWADHMSYSLGGTDYPLDYGTALPAPATGTLHTSGRPGPGDEFQCGQVGSAGRRSILILDKPVGPMVAIVFQHQSKFGVDGKHYAEYEDCGWSGASANGKDWGGEVHLHIHGLDAHGNRLDFTLYASSSAASVAGATNIIAQEDDMAIQIIKEVSVPVGTARYGVIGGKSGFSHIKTMDEVNALLVVLGKSELEAVRGVNPVEFDRVAAALSR